MKKLVAVLAAGMLLATAGLASAGYGGGQDGQVSLSKTSVSGGVIGGSAGAFNSCAVSEVGMTVDATAGFTKNGTYSNLKIAGGSATETLGTGFAGSVFAGKGDATATKLSIPRYHR